MTPVPEASSSRLVPIANFRLRSLFYLPFIHSIRNSGLRSVFSLITLLYLDAFFSGLFLVNCTLYTSAYLLKIEQSSSSLPTLHHSRNSRQTSAADLPPLSPLPLAPTPAASASLLSQKIPGLDPMGSFQMANRGTHVYKRSDKSDNYFDLGTRPVIRSHIISFKRINSNKPTARGYHHMLMTGGQSTTPTSALNCSHYASNCHECLRRRRDCNYMDCEQGKLCLNRDDPDLYLPHSDLHKLVSRCHQVEQCPIPTPHLSTYQSFFSADPNSPNSNSIGNSRYNSLQKTLQRSVRVGNLNQKQLAYQQQHRQQQQQHQRLRSRNWDQILGRSPTEQQEHEQQNGSFNNLGLGTMLALMVCSSLVLTAMLTVAYKKIKKIYVTSKQKRNPYGTLHDDIQVN